MPFVWKFYMRVMIDVFKRIAATGCYLSVCLLSLFAVSCAEDRTDSVTGNGSDGYLQLEFTRDVTRTDIAEDGSGSFTAGDVVGLYVDNGSSVQYRELTYDGSEWLPRLKRSEFGLGALTLSAHYPAQGAADGEASSRSFSVSEDQSADGVSASDLLFATVSLGENQYRADFRFTHLMHRLRIVFIGETDVMDLAVRSIAGGSVDLLEGNVSVSQDAPEWIVPHKVSEGNYEAFVFPQPAAPYREGDGLLRVRSTERESFFNAPELTYEGEALVAFESGKQTTVRLSIRIADQDLSNKILWAQGIDAPDFPGEDNIPSYSPAYIGMYPEGEWFREDLTAWESQYLTWKAGCGWYDCNKSAEYNENDANLCWAAAASNLILWWMANNKAYIEAYDKEFGSSVASTVGDGTVFERPSGEFLPLYYNGTTNRAPVFEFFKSNFPNIGSWESAGVNWFITGNDNYLLTPNIKGFPGFFTNVFKRTDIIATDSSRHPDGATFNKFVSEALLKGQPLGFGAYGVAGPGTSSHAMVIWGVEFDEAGVVSHVYYCDNNNSFQDPNGAVIVRAEIAYAEDGGVEKTYLKPLENKDGNPVGKFLIISLCSVDLRQDIWRQKYPSVVAE